MAEALTEKGARVTGIDPAGQAVEAARLRAAARGQDIPLANVGRRKKALPYGDERHSMQWSASTFSNMSRMSCGFWPRSRGCSDRRALSLRHDNRKLLRGSGW